MYRQIENSTLEEEFFCFTGGIESITDGRTLWVRGDDLTISVSLEKTKCYLLPKHEEGEMPEAPEQIRWNRVSTLTEGVKVFIGGVIRKQNNRLTFVSTKENPLIVIFYNCPDTLLTSEIIRSARTRSEYWNTITPVSLVIGVMALVYIASSLLGRPAFRLTVIAALIAVFVPALPIIPPGLLFTVFYRRLAWHSRKLRADRDLARLEEPSLKTFNRSLKAYSFEVIAWLALLFGIFINFVFILLILTFLGVI